MTMDLGRYEAPAISFEVSIASIVEDAAIISLSAVRLAAKNLIIVRALRDRVDYDDDWYVFAIRTELEALATEKDHDARRMESELTAARTKRGRGMHPSDYRSADVISLSRRKLTLNALAHKLRTMATDADVAHTILSAARLDALDEITASASRPPTPPKPLSRALRTRALRDLAQDIEDLVGKSSSYSESVGHGALVGPAGSTALAGSATDPDVSGAT